MTLDELAQSISSQGLLPIPVEGEVDEGETSVPLFAGTLEEYLKMLKVPDTKGVLILSRKLAESDFSYDTEEEPYDNEEEFSEDEQDSEGDDSSCTNRNRPNCRFARVGTIQEQH